MKLAHIVPPNLVDSVYDILDPSYELTLPALFPHERYRDYYKLNASYGMANVIKILDNGEAEGVKTRFSMLVQMATVLNANEIVLPDVIGDADKTLEAVAAVYREAFPLRNQFKFMFVVQGKTVGQMLDCAERFVKQFGAPHAFGLPRHLLTQDREFPSSRARLAQELYASFGSKIQLHLLGTNPSYPYEVRDQRGAFEDAKVRGVDTSLAWNATLSDILLEPKSLNYNLYIERQPIEAFYEAVPQPGQLALLRANMEAMNEWVR